MRVLRAITAVAVVAMVATALGLWLWVRPDLARVENMINSAQAPLPKQVMAAIVAVEDPDFARRSCGHTLAKLESAIVARWSDWRLCGPLRGASLTEKLAGWEIQGRSISRIVRQLLVTYIVDWRYEDIQIATAYANQVYLGKVGERRVYGVPVATAAYFAKPPDELSLAQLASLVATIRSPSVFSPFANTERARARRRTVLGQIVSAGLATSAEAAQAETQLARGGI